MCSTNGQHTCNTTPECGQERSHPALRFYTAIRNTASDRNSQRVHRDCAPAMRQLAIAQHCCCPCSALRAPQLCPVQRNSVRRRQRSRLLCRAGIALSGRARLFFWRLLCLRPSPRLLTVLLLQTRMTLGSPQVIFSWPGRGSTGTAVYAVQLQPLSVWCKGQCACVIDSTTCTRCLPQNFLWVLQADGQPEHDWRRPT